MVDGSLKAEVREPMGPVRALHLTSRLSLGATIDYRDGFTGCMRALLLNGILVDLRKEANKGLYGIVPGCIGRCDSSPCLNNGTCTERYDGYVCDCRWSAFKGPICADGMLIILICFQYLRFYNAFIFCIFQKLVSIYDPALPSNTISWAHGVQPLPKAFVSDLQRPILMVSCWDSLPTSLANI